MSYFEVRYMNFIYTAPLRDKFTTGGRVFVDGIRRVEGGRGGGEAWRRRERVKRKQGLPCSWARCLMLCTVQSWLHSPMVNKKSAPTTVTPGIMCFFYVIRMYSTVLRPAYVLRIYREVEGSADTLVASKK